MRLRTQVFILAVAAAAAILGFSATAPQAQAEEPLRWKFKVGEKLDYTMVQEMNMSSPGGPAGQMKTNMRQEMDMIWDVQGVNEEGEAVIKQKFDRIKMKMTTPIGNFEYDSKSEEAPTGFGAMIAPMYKAMTKGDFEITMTSRGEVKDVKIPEDVITALKSSPGAAAMGEIATKEGFTKMISQGALVLPKDPPKQGETWNTKIEMNNQNVGKQTVETTYKYEGTKDIDGTKYAVIKPELKMDFGGGNAQITMKISEQSSDGEVLFNIDKGRLYSTMLTQKVAIDASAGGQTTQQLIDQKIEVKVTPAGERKAEADKRPAAEEKPAIEAKDKAEATEKKDK